MKRPLPLLLWLLLALVMVGLPLGYLFLGQRHHSLSLQGPCRQQSTPCRLIGDDLEVQLRITPHLIELLSSRPLVAATAQPIFETGDPPTITLYSGADRHHWAAASADELAEFPGEAIELRLTLQSRNATWTATLTAEPHGN